jgi:hypothetical protein
VNARCSNNVDQLGCSCWTDECSGDSACPAGNTCACRGSPYAAGPNTCVPGNCRVDADCGPGGWCSPSSMSSGCAGISGYYCHTPNDQCVNDSDCRPLSTFPYCRYDRTVGYWSCQSSGVCPGG